MKTKVLVTGADSQLAKCLKESYHKNTDDVEYVFFTRHELDITDKDSIDEVLDSEEFHYCLNCAAYTAVDKAEDEPDLSFEVNATGTENLARAILKKGIVLIHISTDYVFNGQKNEPYRTDDLTAPLNVYGQSKLRGEQCIKEHLKKFFIIRTSWLYSPYGHNFVKTVAGRVKNNLKMTIDNSQCGSPTSAYDLADFIHSLIAERVARYGLYHYTASDHATWYELAMFVAEHYSQDPETLISPIARYETKAERPQYSVLDLAKTLEIYGDIPSWKASVSTVLRKMNTVN